MGFGGIGIWQLLIVLAIVILLFGTKRLGSIGSDLGKAIKGFKTSVKDEDAEKKAEEEATEAERNVEDKTDASQASTEQHKAESKDETRP